MVAGRVRVGFCKGCHCATEGSGATHQTSIEGSAKVVLTLNSCEFRAQAKVAVGKGRRAQGRSRRSGVSAFAVPSCEVAVIQTLLETLPCLSHRWIQKRRAHEMNRVQLWVTRGEGVAVQNAPVSIVKGIGESNSRSAASRQSKRGVRGLWHTEVL